MYHHYMCHVILKYERCTFVDMFTQVHEKAPQLDLM